MASAVASSAPAVERYLDLLEDELMGLTQMQRMRPALTGGSIRRGLAELLRKRDLELMRPSPETPSRAEAGRGVPDVGYTMIGRRRLRSLRSMVVEVIEQDVPGDLIETGIWRGGVVAYMRAILAALGVKGRTVVGADSFDGLPPPDPERYPVDAGRELHKWRELAISREQVEQNLERFDLLDEQVELVAGFFRDTLPGLRGRTWAIVRLDGDMYESTMDGLTNLYDGLSVGGYLVIDDYAVRGCPEAVADFRRNHAIETPIERIDRTGVYWKKQENESPAYEPAPGR